MDDFCHFEELWIIDLIFFNDAFKTANIVVSAQLSARHIKGDAITNRIAEGDKTKMSRRINMCVNKPDRSAAVKANILPGNVMLIRMM